MFSSVVNGSDFLRARQPRGSFDTRGRLAPLWVVWPTGSRRHELTEGGVVEANNDPGDGKTNAKFDDEDYPAFSMGSAAQMLGTTPAFLRSLDESKLLAPQRSEGGHRRYSRYQLRIATRVRELVDHGTALDAACRIIILEDQLAEAQAMNAELHRSLGDQRAPSTNDPPTERQ